MNPFPVEDHTIFLTLAGSQAHGTAHEGSDVDLRGVCIAPLSVRLSLFRSFEQHEGALPAVLAESVRSRIEGHPTAHCALDIKTECVIFDIAKFVGLCAAANPNALEILFADERDWVLETPRWRRLYAERRRFLTKKVKETFHGYALAQLKKIKTHRAWLLSPPAKKPSRDDFGFSAVSGSGGTLSRDDQNRIEESIAKKIRSYGIDNIDMPKATRIAVQERLDALCRDVLACTDDDVDDRLRAVATHGLELPPGVVSVLNAEKKYRAAMKHWDAYQTWKAHRNPARAELERKYGYDTKHAMHLIRLMRMGFEVLETKDLRVRRDDADELSAIRDGAMSFEALLGAANRLQGLMDEAARATTLPDDVDRDEVDGLLAAMLGVS
ncbi:MAG: nucleotidyltransferase domain-containing protein [Deltaproteobacteria bacterium]|nr:nucleotidyltransferase domain-containing protein [Deltaproteobacteria bacterium]